MCDGAGSREEAMRKEEENGNNTQKSVRKLSVWKVIKIDVKEALGV